MTSAELASQIISVQESFDPDELISMSAQPDNVLIRQFYCDPQSGVSLLQDYTDGQLDKLFSPCKSLDEATAKIAKVYGSKPLDAAESALARDMVLRATLDAVQDIAFDRQLDGCEGGVYSILVLVVNDLQQFIGTFRQ